MSTWEVHAVKYAERNARTRADSFIFDDNHDAPHAMDYFMWVLRRGDEVILVDTGYDQPEAASRERPILLATNALHGGPYLRGRPARLFRPLHVL